jgi:hypothetical protein
MIIDINETLFDKVMQIVKSRNLTLFNELEAITPLTVTADTTLIKARTIKTQRVKQSIKETIKSLYKQGIAPTKYKINKLTGISFITLNKYYSNILREVASGNELRS